MGYYDKSNSGSRMSTLQELQGIKIISEQLEDEIFNDYSLSPEQKKEKRKNIPSDARRILNEMRTAGTSTPEQPAGTKDSSYTPKSFVDAIISGELQSNSPEVVKQYKSMSPEDQRAVMEELKKSGKLGK
jgi:predicted Fe-S protein YdhL (DUF1289 family)